MKRTGRRLLLAGSAALLAAILGAGAARAAGPRASVIDGIEAAPGTFPYLAFVYFENETEAGSCTGTVVSSNVVLTAAHCVLDDTLRTVSSPADYVVVTGNVNWSSRERTVSSVSRIAVDPDFRYTVPGYVPVRADAAVLRLSQPVSSPSVRLATSRTWEAGTGATIAGWGLTTAHGTVPTTLHVGEAVVQSRSFCEYEFGAFQSAWQLCTLDYPEYRFTTCSGDSGGPLLMVAPGTAGEALEIGITSFGDVGCPTEAPAYFSRVDAVAAWVQGRIGEWSSAPAPEAAPQPTTGSLPALGGRRAGALALNALRTQLRGRFRGHRGYGSSCRRVARSKQRCLVAWRAGDREYRGAVTVFYVAAEGGVAWNDRFTIRQVSRRCRLFSRHPAACPVTVFRR